MRLTDFLTGVGRPVAYYPSLRRITGSTNATIFLCQLIYWKGKEADPNGWLYKESDEIEKETGLSYGEQKTARRLLVEAGLIEEHYARLDHQMRFLVNLDVINEKWGIEETSVPESGKPQLGNEQKPRSLIESESTTETTTTGFSQTNEVQEHYSTAYHRGEQERPDKVSEWLKLVNAPGLKEQARLDALLSAFGEAFTVNTETAEWKKLAKHAISEQKLKGYDPQVFIEWVKRQKGYPEFWSCKRMLTEYPRAFVNNEKDDEKLRML
jgi:hypothetical protein